jgi:hypothetical protein
MNHTSFQFRIKFHVRMQRWDPDIGLSPNKVITTDLIGPESAVSRRWFMLTYRTLVAAPRPGACRKIRVKLTIAQRRSPSRQIWTDLNPPLRCHFHYDQPHRPFCYGQSRPLGERF